MFEKKKSIFWYWLSHRLVTLKYFKYWNLVEKWFRCVVEKKAALNLHLSILGEIWEYPVSV